MSKGNLKISSHVFDDEKLERMARAWDALEADMLKNQVTIARQLLSALEGLIERDTPAESEET